MNVPFLTSVQLLSCTGIEQKNSLLTKFIHISKIMEFIFHCNKEKINKENCTIRVPTSLTAPVLILDCMTHHFLKCAPADIAQTVNSKH